MTNKYYKAIICNKLGSPDLLNITQLPRRPLHKGEARLKISAAGINFPDFLMINGKYQYKPPLPFIPGMEISGYVIDHNKDNLSENIDVSKLYIAQVKTGGFSEEIILPIKELQRAPNNFSEIEAASYFIAAKTAYVSLIERARICPNERILILGAAGGVGLAAIQLALTIKAKPIAVVSSVKKRKILQAMGVKDVILISENIYEKTMQLTDKQGVNVVYDPVGGEICKEAVKCLSWGGRLLIVGFASGEFTNLRTNYILIKGISVLGVRAGEYTRQYPEKNIKIINSIKDLAEKGVITPRIHKVFKLSNIKNAFKQINNRQVIGKLVFKI